MQEEHLLLHILTAKFEIRAYLFSVDPLIESMLPSFFLPLVVSRITNMLCKM